MTEYERRLARIRANIARGVEEHHRRHGTDVPTPDQVTVRSVIADHLHVEFPAIGATERQGLGMSVSDDDRVDAHNIARIVSRATMWQAWHVRIREIAEELPAELERLTRNTDVEIVEVVGTGVSGSDVSMTVHSFVDVRQLDGSLRPHVARWSIERIEDRVGGSRWNLRESGSLLSTQRKRSKLLREAGGRPNIVVERSLATRLLSLPDRSDVSRKLFAAAHGQAGTKVPWRTITLLEAREGRIVGTIPISNAARIRDDRLTVKGTRLPTTVADALRGRPASAVAEHELLEGRTIRSVSNRKDGLVVELERDDVDFIGLRRALDGED